MNPTPTTCPHCGAEEVKQLLRNWSGWSCGTHGPTGATDLVTIKPECYSRQIAALKAELAGFRNDIAHWKAVAEYHKALSPVQLVQQLTTQRAALEKAREAILWVIDHCQWCGGSGRDNDGEAELNEACPRCSRFGEPLATINAALEEKE